MEGILDGIRIVSMEHHTVIPMATVLMADWGADVIKIEPLTREYLEGGHKGPAWIKLGGVEVDPYSHFIGRNKKSGIRLNL